MDVCYAAAEVVHGSHDSVGFVSECCIKSRKVIDASHHFRGLECLEECKVSSATRSMEIVSHERYAQCPVQSLCVACRMSGKWSIKNLHVEY